MVGAGHPPLLILRRDGSRELVESCAPPLGLAARDQFVKSIVNLAPGDTFVLYTDGLYGGSDGPKSRLTPVQLAEKLDPAARNAEAQLTHVLNAAAPTKDNGSLPDDLAAIVVRRKK